MPKSYKTHKKKAKRRLTKKNKKFIFDASKVHPASLLFKKV
jgi:hypothetical protein